jgi:hypothetical protein
MPSLRKRCKNGTRKNKNRECVSVVRLSESDVDALLLKHGLRSDAAPKLKRLRLSKRSSHDYKYNKLFDDKTNLMRQADSFITNVLAKETPSKRKLMFKTLKKPLKLAPIQGTRF